MKNNKEIKYIRNKDGGIVGMEIHETITYKDAIKYFPERKKELDKLIKQ
jgi:hypothetical protein